MAKKKDKNEGKGKKDKAAATTLDPCHKCGAKCCHDLVMPIEKPKTDSDVFEMKWELQYDTVNVFIRSHRWYRMVLGRCQYLDKHDRCTIYQRRPSRCREMKPPDCEHFGEFYDTMINTPEELDAYLESRKRR